MIELDDVDRMLLRELARDAGQTAGALGRKVDLSQPATWRRIERLKSLGVIAGRRLELDREKLGFGVTIAELIQGAQGHVSSTRIREALSAGKPRDAADMLGHWHRIEGMVIGGEQRGRELGYPTANMSIDGLHPPHFGVYAVLVDVQDGAHKGRYHGVASMGVRPMFGMNRPNLETFIFDFSGDLYGATLSVALVEYLRGEEKFDGLDALITQMDADSAQSREILASL